MRAGVSPTHRLWPAGWTPAPADPRSPRGTRPVGSSGARRTEQDEPWPQLPPCLLLNTWTTSRCSDDVVRVVKQHRRWHVCSSSFAWFSSSCFPSSSSPSINVELPPGAAASPPAARCVTLLFYPFFESSVLRLLWWKKWKKWKQVQILIIHYMIIIFIICAWSLQRKIIASRLLASGHFPPNPLHYSPF